MSDAMEKNQRLSAQARALLRRVDGALAQSAQLQARINVPELERAYQAFLMGLSPAQQASLEQQAQQELDRVLQAYLPEPEATGPQSPSDVSPARRRRPRQTV